MKIYIALLPLCYLVACQPSSQSNNMNYKTTGTIVCYDTALDALLDSTAKAEIIATGYKWSEGPLWVEAHNMLLFSDIPANTVYKWTEVAGAEVYLTPSGYTGMAERTGEIGSNGLILDAAGRLVLCQHGNRQMAAMNAPLDSPEAKFIALATSYNGKRLSSPNDAVYHSNGELYFTDPPYGLVSQNDNDPEKEIPFNGVYKVKTNGEVILLVDSIPRPNGIAFLPGEKQIIISSSDGEKPFWYRYDLAGDSLTNGCIFYNAQPHKKPGVKGSPDGLKIDKEGNVFATGPGGVFVFNKAGKLLGLVQLSEPASNIALSPDEKTMYITNNMQILRLKMRK